jgi:hypothetical protein
MLVHGGTKTMADRQRWLWAIYRLANRNRWTFFGSFAVLTILGNAIVFAVFDFNDPLADRGLSDFFPSFAVGAVVAILFWTAMALGNLFLERRGRALGTEAGIEMLAGVRSLAQSLKPPTLTTVVVVAVIFGGLAGFGGGFPSGVASAGTWLIGGLFVRWAWLKPSTSTRRLAAVSVMAGLGVMVLDFLEGLFGPEGTINEALIAGAVMAGLAFVFALMMKRLASPSADSASRLALEIRDRALTLASDGVDPGDAAQDLLASIKGRRHAAEMAWDILRKRPKDDLVSARAWVLVDQAIREEDWGWWPWRGEAHAGGDER